ncbi:MAG: hypothetical protein Q7N87_05305 [Candidatus Uhrbacteria bacterium]|nr:hypothetical protein [Candidatus Uhrbacteria bacterium]
MKNRGIALMLVLSLVGVAFFNFCRFTMMPVMQDQGTSITAMNMTDMADCKSNPMNCPMGLAQHQNSFFQLFPAVASRIAITVVFALLALWVLLYFETPRDLFFLKPFFDRRKIFIASPMLLLAFRRGILNPKIF